MHIRYMTPVEKALAAVKKQELQMARAAQRKKSHDWKVALKEKIPQRVYVGLQNAFCKAFSIVFKQGKGVIEKTYHKEELQAVHKVRDRAVQEGGRKELRQLERRAKSAGSMNMAATTVEGMALGVLGIGMPDIVLFLGTLLRGIYETALSYGFDHDSQQEQLLILKMMCTALSTGENWSAGDAEVEQMLEYESVEVTEAEFDRQIKRTAQVFAMDMLLLKFVQGLPVVGIVGGAANPVYYRKVMRYVEVKYRKRYLCRQRGTG
ncbi:MAG: EcsC family protein [Oscillospiraceae bacterium]|nr:EcsC family protein [Oscillospiraceae bacterium]